SSVAIEGLPGIYWIAQTRPVGAGASGETVGATTIVVLGGVLGKEGTVTGAVCHNHARGVVDRISCAGCRVCRIVDMAGGGITNVIICRERMIDVINAIAAISNGASLERFGVPG